MRILTILAICLLLGACERGPVGNNAVPEPAKAVDLKQYLGLWYEVARYENRFEKGCEGVTAEYALREDGLIDVINTCRQGAVDGPEEVANGKAKIVENSQNAKLKVSFFGPFYFGNYWVLDRAEDYSWSIVGEPSGRYLWFLSRKAKLDESELAMLTNKAKAMSYDISLLYFTKQ